MSNMSDSASSGYPNTENEVENTTRSGMSKGKDCRHDRLKCEAL